MGQHDRRVARAILSRAALYARDWDTAYSTAESLLEQDGYLMSEGEFKSGFNDISNSEWIWGHPQTDDQSSPSYQFHYLDTTTPGSYYYSFNVDPYFKENYEDGDYRKEMINWGIDPGGDPKTAGLVWMRNSKFRFRNMDTLVADIILMRNAEVYLIAAEAGAHLGKPNALQRLNDVREARGAKPKSSSGEDLLEDIYLERRLELWGEGFGVVDIIRLQKSVERKEWPQTEADYVEYSWIDEDGVEHSRNIQPQGHRIVKFPDQSDFSANSKYYLFRITTPEELANKNLYKNHPRP
ncbi:MAG: RagB/SusD family nutrient uptake outer membrane protein [Muribaculaceae bacterium]|nr:RagB/SusD family nutrient uptake outer membrane protein [Muribaculaceae bacterium]